MTFQANISEFAEFMGTEIKRIEKKIPTDGGSGGGSQSSDSMIITGNGRPDKPATTNGKITDNEPNGTFYNSLDGASVGAYLWQKQNGNWIVISGDTGSRIMKRAVNIKSGYVYLQRINNLVTCWFTGGAWSTISFYGSSNPKFKRKSHAKRMDILMGAGIPIGFRASTSFMLPFYNDEGDSIGMIYLGGKTNSSYIELRFKENIPTADLDMMRLPVITWVTDDPFPETLP